jgi:hypothetical protein
MNGVISAAQTGTIVGFFFFWEWLTIVSQQKHSEASALNSGCEPAVVGILLCEFLPIGEHSHVPA